jgi:hypothetical protein
MVPRPQRRWLAAAAAGLLMLVPASAAHAYEPRVPEGYFGVSAPGLSVMARDSDPRLAVHAQAIQESGLDFVRSTVDWRQVEPLLGAGGIHLYDWAATDRLVRGLAERDLELLPNVMGTPAWARASDALLCGPGAAVDQLHAGAFGDFAAAVIRRYGRNGTFWSANPSLTPQPVRRIEIWNEPNWTGFWCPQPQPERFAKLALAAARSIDAADPQVETTLGGLVVTKENLYFAGGGMRGMETGTFLARMIAEEPELASRLDSVGVHLYDADPDVNLSLLGWVRSRMRDAGLTAAALTVTEFGWTTSGSPDALSEEARADAYTALVEQLPRTDCDVRALAAHDWSTPEVDPADPEHWFGIADPSTGALHPAGAAYRDAVALFEGRGPTPAPRETIPVCGAPAPDQDSDGTPDETDDYPLDPVRDSGSGEVPPAPDPPEQAIRPPAADDRFFAITSAFMPADPEERALHYEAMGALGVRSIRQSVEWDIVEPQDGSGATRFAWSDTDRRMVALAKRGISTSLAPLHAPAWLPGTPAAADARFAQFLGALAERYGSQGRLWAENGHLDRSLAPRDFEIWTEVNRDGSAWDGTASPGEYAATYLTGRAALSAADPNARAIVSLVDGGEGSSAAAFLRDMVTARPELAGRIDGVYVMAVGARSADQLDTVAARARAALDATGNSAARLKLGFGAPTAGPGAMTEEARAAFVAEAASRLPRSDCDVDEAVLFSWTSAQADSSNAWDWYGVAALGDGTPTSTAHGFIEMARAFTGYGETVAPAAALHPCVREPLDRDSDGTPDAADPAPLDPSQSTPSATPPPAPGFDQAPAQWSNQPSPLMRYSAAGATSYHCRLDAGGWEACGSQRQLSGLVDGPHSFSVRAVDALGLVGPTSRHEWTVDTRKPETTIASGPSGLTPNDSVAFGLTSDEQGARFLCRLDARPWEWCSSTPSFTGLGEGSHTFDAVAVDRAGNADPSQANRYFEVRTVPATPSVQASGLATQTPTFTFSAAHAASYRCRFDSAEFGPCSGPASHTPAQPLAKGSHRFEVRGVGPTGKLGPVAGWSFTTDDTRPPETTIVAGPAAVTRSSVVEFRLASDEPGAVLWCKLDGAPWARCEATVTYSDLAEGPHSFSAAAVDSAGNTDPTPAQRDFTVDLDTEAPELTLKPLTLDRSRRATVRFAASDDSGAVATECSVNGGAWRDCGSPYRTGRLKPGKHRIGVRAADDSGNSVTRLARFRVRGR